MQVVFVHGVNTRDLGDGDYEKWVAGRTDRLNRLAFGGKATILNPYWGKFGLSGRSLKSIPSNKGAVVAFEAPLGQPSGSSVLEAARRDFSGTIGAVSVAAISEATLELPPSKRHELEDFWFSAAKFADAGPPPNWLSTVTSDRELLNRLVLEVDGVATAEATPMATPIGGGWKPSLPLFDGNAFAATKAREFMAGYLAQFLGDALMFFSRREQSSHVRKEISASLVSAARNAHDQGQPLILIGYSMGGGVLHEMLSDPEAVLTIETELGRPLRVDLFLSVGSQIGMFAELKQFATTESGAPLSVEVDHYWNVFDYYDTLAFLCEPVLPGTIDMEVSTAANIAAAHGSYFESALFFERLRAKLVGAGLL